MTHSLFKAVAFTLLIPGLVLGTGCGEETTYEDDSGIYGSAEENPSEIKQETGDPEADNDQSDQLSSALENGDLEACYEITTQVVQESCVTNVSMQMARETNEASSCDPITNEEAKQNCLALIQE